ncbi:MAG TPA: chemotaxis protein CheB, partial [Bryobacteraceae bacterium]|nr:chemotaxis protein CheB [Bryobacteraceae bacterium]
MGIGASAGGLEAFSELLTHLPSNTGLAFVFIQHLDPRHESLLTELLQQRTGMKVQTAANEMKPEPNCVYVIPPNVSMEIENRTLRLSSRPAGAQQMPIDCFFRSLAADLGTQAIGVVLSGSASDGTLGLKAIKGEGGITFAQEPASASFDSMPRSAIVAECVDLVLTPAGIAQELVRIKQHPYVSDPDMTRARADQERDFSEVLNILRSTSAVDFSMYKPGTIRRRIYRRMALHKLETPGDYVRFLRERHGEAEALFQDLLIHVTAFFREPATFQALHDRVFPALFPNRGAEEPIRVWIPGCSTGEEAYSVAMSIQEFLFETGVNIAAQIFGTDLSDRALERARAGLYPESISADVSADRLRTFFTKVNGHYQISRNIRDMCIFARQNVTKDPPFSHLDLLMCRNLLIYLGPGLQKKMMKVFHYALKPSGFLVLGISESIGGSSDLFSPIDRTLKIYTRKAAPSPSGVNFESHDNAG